MTASLQPLFYFTPWRGGNVFRVQVSQPIGSWAASSRSIFLPEEKGRGCFLIGFLGHLCKRFAGFFKAFFVAGCLPQLNWTCVPEDFSPPFVVIFLMMHSDFFTLFSTHLSPLLLLDLHAGKSEAYMEDWFLMLLVLFFSCNICMQLWHFKNRRQRSLKGEKKNLLGGWANGKASL